MSDMGDLSKVRTIAHVYHFGPHEPDNCPVLPTWPVMCRCCPIHDRHEDCPHDTRATLDESPHA